VEAVVGVVEDLSQLRVSSPFKLQAKREININKFYLTEVRQLCRDAFARNEVFRSLHCGGRFRSLSKVPS